MGAPVGATGIIACGRPSATPSEPAPPRSTFRGALEGGYSFSNLSFPGVGTVAVGKWFVAYESDFMVSDRVSLALGAGSLLLGHLTLPHGSRALGPGWLGSFSASFRVVDDKGLAPYVVLSASTSATGTVTRERPTDAPGARGTYLGVDFRLGATVGKTFARVVSPYVAARVFGGPVLFREAGETRVGTDAYHFQPAIGAAFLLPRNVDLFVEGAPYFERGVSGGVGIRN